MPGRFFAVERVRLLPVVMGCAAMLFGLKVNDVWNGVIDFDAGISSAQAATDVQANETEKAEEQDTPLAIPAAPAAELGDAGELSESEVQLLQRLSDRREELEAQARELDTQRTLLVAAEKRVAQRIAKLEELESTVSGLIEQFDTQEEARMSKLVEVYQNMKAKSAARIFNELDMHVLLAVAMRMNENKMAEVLGKMDPKAAQELTIEMARQRQLPETAG
ncbi:MAG TPA: hypothetical protein DDW95_05975 [Alphaproteobacteria bacterium]|jgi:flagellar motility protein MotE (MotC chaperone)|nr:hypothetical protein [Alphaproteobacteria bacterium]HBA41671.1 hypothetical protein [Alphaproteobacteria bacterium]HBC53464.1 hypothetical protein [Alphaproteobacteria bacterium]HBF98079.1 hypothetical protein [Alphaproteobacteria bacterium]HCO92250.1 hypothetical protein [Alphaproteobacteria bacterium]